MIMKYDPQQHRRRSIRLRGYDYSSPGTYFITICTHNKQVLFGRVLDGQMQFNGYGEIVQEEWFRSATIRKEIRLDAWIVMPNHVHGIVTIAVEAHIDAPSTSGTDDVGSHGDAPGTQTRATNVRTRGQVTRGASSGAHDHAPPLRIPPRRARSLATFVGGFKGAAKIRINEMRRTPGVPVWQENYYEHIVRDEDELNKIREYILTNPLRWIQDWENPDRRLTDDLHEYPDWYV
jgi:putative transposase